MNLRPPIQTLALVLAAALSSCVSNRPSAQIPLGNWEPEAARVASSTATPKHSLSRAEYPFDPQGNYIAAWAAGRVQEPAPAARPAPAPAPAPTPQSLWASNAPQDSTPIMSTRRPSDASIRKPTNTVPLDSQAALAAALAKVDEAVGATAAPRTSQAPEPQPSSSSNSRYHKVGSSDTLWGLSRKYGTTVAAIQRANGLSDSTIRTGSTLKIPG